MGRPLIRQERLLIYGSRNRTGGSAGSRNRHGGAAGMRNKNGIAAGKTNENGRAAYTRIDDGGAVGKIMIGVNRSGLSLKRPWMRLE